ncbi:uncharacterized protein LOC124892432, partial [Capsicum annuum]|uniref:uncharacterized protein LOC124892432 n=1 Tax=Capsicum annuum TaxID=4072 RepID=UPI001FB0DB62
MPDTESKNTGERVDVATGEGTIQGQAIPAAGPSGTDRAASLRTQDFLKMDPPTFTGSDLNEDPQDFIDQIQRTLEVMHVSGRETVELAAVHRYVDGLDPYLVRDCTIAALNKDMVIARIQAFAQKMEDQRQRKRTQEFESGSSKRARSTQGSSAPPQHQGFRGSQFGQRSEGHSSRSVGYHGQGNMSQSRTSRELCNRCGKHHMGVRRMGTNVCFWCGMTGHMMRECPRRSAGGVTQPSGSAVASSSPVSYSGRGVQPAGHARNEKRVVSSSGTQNRTYALADRQNLEASSDVVT